VRRDQGRAAFFEGFFMSRPPFLAPAASRRSNIASFIAMDVMREAKTLARAGAEIVHCEVGEPGAAPPRPVREAAIAALEQAVPLAPPDTRPALEGEIAVLRLADRPDAVAGP